MQLAHYSITLAPLRSQHQRPMQLSHYVHNISGQCSYPITVTTSAASAAIPLRSQHQRPVQLSHYVHNISGQCSYPITFTTSVANAAIPLLYYPGPITFNVSAASATSPITFNTSAAITISPITFNTSAATATSPITFNTSAAIPLQCSKLSHCSQQGRISQSQHYPYTQT